MKVCPPCLCILVSEKVTYGWLLFFISPYLLIFPNSLDESFGGLGKIVYFCRHETNEERSYEDAAQPIGK